MQPLRIFVASSTEGAAIATKLRARLQGELSGGAIVEFWKHSFAPGDTAIESLEKVTHVADFAVLVMTADDITVSRDKKKMSPRDNLVFELGLFIGALGRKHSVVMRDSSVDLKIPSDYLGVTVLTYNAASPDDLTRSLHEASIKLAEHINDVPPTRMKRLAEGSYADNETFCRQIEGAWWQRINHPEGSALSFFMITADALPISVIFEGTSYGKDGQLSAQWRSEMTRLYPADRRITYLWSGKHPVPGYTHLDFHGYGTLQFKPGHDSSSQFTSGNGHFWDVAEHDPSNTAVKPIELCRVLDKHIPIMSSGTSKKKADLVLKLLKIGD